MQVTLFDHLLLLAAVVCGAKLLALLRRPDGVHRGYGLLVGAELLLSVFAMGADRFFGTIVLAAVTLTVVVPSALEYMARWTFARGHLVWVLRLSSLRATLMPGSGLTRHLPILEGLALLDRDGVDAALGHFRRLADEVEDQHELAMIHEQIISMLFHGQRWDEGIAHYERRFHAGYAAVRPSLALGLLRAYGESGQLETAAGLLRELEEGPVGADPKTAELLGQARLTFLAYAGAVDPVERIVERHCVDLGLSAATAELFKGIAHAHAGEPREAVETLTKVEELAGPRDRRVREAARAVLERARAVVRAVSSTEADAADVDPDPDSAAAVELAPELRSYVELVAFRLQKFLVAYAPIRRHERSLATYAVMVLLSVVYGVHLLRGGGGPGLLELGALSEDLWRAGSWGRVFTSAWIHIDLVGLLFDVYAIWLSGQIVERVLGPARMAIATVCAAIAGMAASVLALPLLWDVGLDALAVVAPTGGNLMAVGAIVAALCLLVPGKTPALPPRSRRNLLITLSLLLLANLLTSWPGTAGVGVAPVALLVTALVASITVITSSRDPSRGVELGLAVILAGVLLVNGVAAALVLGEDPEGWLVDHRAQRCEVDGIVLRTPIGLTPIELERDVPFDVPLIDGLIDTLELRDGSIVQLAVVHGDALDGETTALFRLVEGLELELSATAAGPLPEPFAEQMAASTRWRAADLWRNGERVARVVERSVPDAGDGPATVMLVASPASAIEHAPAVYAAILRDAAWVEGDARRTRCTVE